MLNPPAGAQTVQAGFVVYGSPGAHCIRPRRHLPTLCNRHPHRPLRTLYAGGGQPFFTSQNAIGPPTISSTFHPKSGWPEAV